MRRVWFVVLVLTLVASASKGLASTDCERWLSNYKKELGQKETVQRALAAKNRARAYARRTVGHLISPAAAPAPHPARPVVHHPHLTPAQMLKRFDLMCGELPTEPQDQVLDSRMAPDEFISEMAMSGPMETESSFPAESMLSSEEPVAYVPSSVTPGGNYSSPMYPVYGPSFGSSATPVLGSVPAGSTPVSTLPSIPPAIPPASPVPEPGSFVLMLTGAVGAVAAMKRRLGLVA